MHRRVALFGVALAWSASKIVGKRALGAEWIVAGSVAGLALTMDSPWLGTFLFGAAIGYVFTQGVKSFTAILLTIAATGLSALAGWMVTGFLDDLDFRYHGFLWRLFAGLLLGGFLGAGSLIRGFRLNSDTIENQIQRVEKTVQGDLQVLTRRIGRIYSLLTEAMKIKANRDDGYLMNIRHNIDVVIRSILRLIEKTRLIDLQFRNSDRGRLANQIRIQEKRLAGADDEVVRENIGRELELLKNQKRNVEQIILNRKRVISKIDHSVALLEGFRMTIIGYCTTDASTIATEIAPMASMIESLGKEIDSYSEEYNRL